MIKNAPPNPIINETITIPINSGIVKAHPSFCFATDTYPLPILEVLNFFIMVSLVRSIVSKLKKKKRDARLLPL